MSSPFLPESGIVENAAEAVVALNVMRDLLLEAVAQLRAGNLHLLAWCLGDILAQIDEAHELLTLERPATPGQMPDPELA